MVKDYKFYITTTIAISLATASILLYLGNLKEGRKRIEEEEEEEKTKANTTRPTSANMDNLSASLSSFSTAEQISSKLSATFDKVMEKADLDDIDVDYSNLELALLAMFTKIENNPIFLEKKKAHLDDVIFAAVAKDDDDGADDKGEETQPKTYYGRPDHEDMKSLLPLLHLSNLAYEEDKKVLKEKLSEEQYILLRSDAANEAGEVGRYYAICPERKEFLIGVKGTSSASDAITDCVAVALPHTCVPNNPFQGSGDDEHELRGHEGILTAALNLLDDVSPFVEHMFLPLRYKIKIVGHSLGAGTSALLAVLLRSRFRELQEHEDDEGRQRLHAYCFACPPVLDYESSMLSKSFVTCIVNKSDVVTRCSLGNFEIFVRVLGKVFAEMKKEGKDSHWKLYMTNQEELDDEAFERLGTIFETAPAEVALNHPDHLYVPGEVIYLYENKTDGISVATVDGGHKLLRGIHLDQQLLNDHFVDSYKQSIETCL